LTSTIVQDGDDFVFMDMTTFDTETVPKDVIGTSLALASITIMQ
jgi:translation elongation factor P/translation initiation factor 5A